MRKTLRSGGINRISSTSCVDSATCAISAPLGVSTTTESPTIGASVPGLK